MKKFFHLAAVLGCALLLQSCTDVVVLSGKPIEVTVKAYWDCPHSDRCTQTLEWTKPDGSTATREIYWGGKYTLGAYELGSSFYMRIVPKGNSCPVDVLYLKQSEGEGYKDAYDNAELAKGTTHKVTYKY